MDSSLTPSKEDLLRVTRASYSPEECALFEKTYDFAAAAHASQKRFSGDPYIVHPTATAIYLASRNFAAPVVVAGLLHDVLEDTPVTFEALTETFGEDVATMVSGVSKLGTVKYRGVERYAENLRKMFLAMAADIRVLFIRFADRIHNLRTLDSVPVEKRRRIALETLEIYAPLANRLSMGAIRGELEDLSFKYVLPEEYAWVKSLVEERLEQKQKYVARAQTLAELELIKAGVPFVTVSGRTKHLYSLYQKLLKHERDITKIYDLVALRIHVPTVADCYATLGVLHGRWKPLKGRIKDYIAQPKPNGYQSLHTTVFCEEGEIVEIQIRTPEMHQAAEYGIAAHWQYTEANKTVRALSQQELAWIKEMAVVQEEIGDHKEFLENLEHLKIDVFQNRIFVFTPTGDVIDLPEQATPVDFAYTIHSDIGDTCASARVNGEMASLGTILRSGDMVEIVTDKNRKTPNKDWLKFVKTSNARNKIRIKTKRGLSAWIKNVVTDPLGKKK